ncbi:MAG: hypothetical protein AB1505_19200 [Candidatus Latescibacterota bacterium]
MRTRLAAREQRAPEVPRRVSQRLVPGRRGPGASGKPPVSGGRTALLLVGCLVLLGLAVCSGTPGTEGPASRLGESLPDHGAHSGPAGEPAAALPAGGTKSDPRDDPPAWGGMVSAVVHAADGASVRPPESGPGSAPGAASQQAPQAGAASPQQVAQMRKEIAERRISPTTLRSLLGATAEFCTTPAGNLNALQGVLLSEAFQVPADSISALRWGRYPAPPGSPLAGAVFVTLWRVGASPAECRVVSIDSLGVMRNR